jgi:hypothetical protein
MISDVYRGHNELVNGRQLASAFDSEDKLFDGRHLKIRKGE